MFERSNRSHRLLPLSLLATLHCGSVDPETTVTEPERPSQDALVIERENDSRIAGHYGQGGAAIVFTSQSSSPLSGEVAISAGSSRYDVSYDYGARKVITDGHDGALDRASYGVLRSALPELGERLLGDDSTPPLHEQMLFASLAMLVDSAGMPLPRLEFALDAVGDAPAAEGDAPDANGADGDAPGAASASVDAPVDKSLGNDGVACIERGNTYAVSFDVGNRVVLDEPIIAGNSECNGQCGPECVRLTPWVMWTLDCLEHDTCCGATSADPCWTPLGECGDEYVDAEADFLRGFDPFGRHCSG